MKRLNQFINLSRIERGLLLSALFHLIAIRIGLWTLSLEELVKHVQTLTVSETFRISRPEKIAWAVRVVGRYVPGGSNCLAQALTLQSMLARAGYPSQLRIGVAKDMDGRFTAHAWVEFEGKIMIGKEGVSRLTVLPPLELQRQ